MVYIDQNRSSSTIYRYLPFIATIWFFVIIESYLVWNPLAPLMHSVPSFLLMWGTLNIKNHLEYTKSKHVICIFLTLYIFWAIITLCEDIPQVIRRAFDFVPILFFIFWPKQLIEKTYLIIRKVVLFYAIGSSIVTVLILAGFENSIPHIILPPREALHVRLDIVYYVYGLFVTLCYPVTGVAGRACGMLMEPGHFAVVLGHIYLIERLRGTKVNWWFVICGILTFSSVFMFFVLFTEVRRLFSKRDFKKVAYVLICSPFVLYGIFVLLPEQVQDEIEYQIYGRNLEQVVEAYEMTSSINGALDERASDYSLRAYESMNMMEFLFGGEHIEPGECLSDYRGMIIYMGCVGMFLSILVYLTIISKIPIHLRISLMLSYLLIIVHRSFMLFEPYIYLYAFFVLILANNERLTSNCSFNNGVEEIVE